MRNNKGFSLVELIVVIAIMAILATVAVIGVSVYIPKAQQAADDELLHNINKVFNATCLAEGVNVEDITNAKWDMDQKKLVSVTVKGDTSGSVGAKLVASFANLFDVKNPEFKVYTAIVFNASEHKFINNSDGTYDPNKYAYGDGGYLTLSPEDIEKLQNSTFGQMGMESLMGQLDSVSGIAANLNSQAYNNVLASDGFIESALSSMGISQTEIDSMSFEQRVQTLETRRQELAILALKEQGITNYTEEQLKAAENQIQANAMVLYTAQVTSKMESDQIQNLLDTSTKDQIIANMSSQDKSGEGLAQAAMMCGLYTAYVNSKDFPEGKDKTVDVLTVIDALDDPGFLKFIEDNPNDLEGYLGSLNMISSSTQDPNATTELMIKGFDDPALIAILNQSTKK